MIPLPASPLYAVAGRLLDEAGIPHNHADAGYLAADLLEVAAEGPLQETLLEEVTQAAQVLLQRIGGIGNLRSYLDTLQARPAPARPVQTTVFECPYCGNLHRARGDCAHGADISCCGEVGHVTPKYSPDSQA
jgi:hypothetical protein